MICWDNKYVYYDISGLFRPASYYPNNGGPRSTLASAFKATQSQRSLSDTQPKQASCTNIGVTYEPSKAAAAALKAAIRLNEAAECV